MVNQSWSTLLTNWFPNKIVNLRDIQMLLTARLELTLHFLKSLAFKPYFKRSRHQEDWENKGSLKLDTCFRAQNIDIFCIKRSTLNLNYGREVHHGWLHITCQDSLPDLCLFWAGERPIEILLFALHACLLTRVEHWNKQVSACWHHNKLRNTYLTLVLSRNISFVFPS